MLRKVLTIAGSDSGGGAGIQADLKSFSARGVFGMSAVTALTAQNTLGVSGVFPIDPAFVSLQIETVMDDIGADAWKTGMLGSSRIIEVVVLAAKKYQVEHLVVDPVMISTSGHRLLEQDAEESMRLSLLPLASVITPNRYEAEALTGLSIRNIDELQIAAKKLYEMGPRAVIIKGGHLTEEKDAIDLLYDGKDFQFERSQRFDTKNTHGTGCTFAAALAAELAKGISMNVAFRKVKEYISKAIKLGADYRIGHGHGPVAHFHDWPGL